MNQKQAKLVLSSITALVLLFAAVPPARALAIRTWVSSVGDDASSCGRTSPCKTLGGALSKTESEGEIKILDFGAFGEVTITKSITISAASADAGILVSGTNGIVISAAITDVVVIRGLDIEGFGTGLSGIKVLGAGVVSVESCTINHFTQNGIEFVPSSDTTTTSRLHVSNTILSENTGTGGAIHVKPGANVSATGMIENTVIRNNSVGVRVEDNSQVTAKNTTVADSAGSGFIAASTGAAATLNLDSCVGTGNTNGIKADNPGATIRIAGCTIAGNTNGLVTTGGGHIVSLTGTNHNFDTGAPTGPNVPPQ